jgi:putative addiction module component (TIGR02574 family)
LLEEALKLPPREKAELIERLASSMDPPEQKRIDASWSRECEDRLDAFERGQIRSIPASEVFREVEKRKRG